MMERNLWIIILDFYDDWWMAMMITGQCKSNFNNCDTYLIELSWDKKKKNVGAVHLLCIFLFIFWGC